MSATLKAKWEKAQARYRAVDEAISAFKGELARVFRLEYPSRGERRRLDELNARRDRAADAVFAILEQHPAPRDWRHGVPAWWVAEKLSYEDAYRPLNEPLSVTVPLGYGMREHERMRNNNLNEDAMHSNARTTVADDTAAHELELYLTNDAALFGPQSQAEAVRQNLLRKIKSGTFDFERSVQAWMYVVESGAKAYAKEFAKPSEWSAMFNAATRRAVARSLAEEFYTEAKLGNYDLKGNASKPKPMSGYAYEAAGEGDLDGMDTPNDEWDTIMYTPTGRERFLGVRNIDGARCNVWQSGERVIAQLEHMTRNASPPPAPRRRASVDTSLARVRELSARHEASEKPFDPARSYPRGTKSHHFAVNATDPRDIPEHLRPVHFSGYYSEYEPKENGHSVSYGHFDHGDAMDGETQWYEVEYATGSDYSGSTVEKSNYKVLEEDLLPEAHPVGESPAAWATSYGGHGTFAILVVWDRLAPEVQEALGNLEDYPLLDDDAHSQLEMELEDEAWQDTYQSDFEKAFLAELNARFPDDEEVEDWPEGVDSSSLFRIGMELSNQNWEHSAEGPWIDVKKVAAPLVAVMSGDKEPPKWFSAGNWNQLLEDAKAFGIEVG